MPHARESIRRLILFTGFILLAAILFIFGASVFLERTKDSQTTLTLSAILPALLFVLFLYVMTGKYYFIVLIPLGIIFRVIYLGKKTALFTKKVAEISQKTYLKLTVEPTEEEARWKNEENSNET